MRDFLKIHKHSLPLFFLILIFLTACDRQDSRNNDIIAYVNKEPVFAWELQKSLDLKSRQDPLFEVTETSKAEQLDLIIERKLMIQSAIEDGLAKNDRFLDRIKTFWEQTLIRDFLDHKSKEYKDQVKISYDDIEQYYKRMGYRITFKVYKGKDKGEVDDLLKKFQNKEPLPRLEWETIGPIRYDEVESLVFLPVFDSSEGALIKLKDEPNHYVVTVIHKEKVSIRPLDQMRAGIEKRLLAQKERMLFEDWLKKKRAKSKIRIEK